MDFYAADIKYAFRELDSSENGLSDSEAKGRLLKYGFNEIKKEKGANAIKIFLSQFQNFLLILLIIASLLSLFLREFLEAAGMLSIAVLSAVLGFVQEYRAERAVEALKKRASDIHVEPFENIVRVRYRIDGNLEEALTIPKKN